MDILKLPIERWEEYRDLRLRALKEDPEAFSSSYADSLELPDEFWQKRLSDALAGKGNWLLFARQDDKLVGMIGAYLEPDVLDTATIVSVYVPREERGKGISVRLMEEMLRVLSEMPALRRAKLHVNAGQFEAVGLYRRFGFAERGTRPATTGAGEAVEQIIMERDLPAGDRV